MRWLTGLLPCLLWLLAAPAWAASHYFSDCAQGGTGDIGTPYCVDPLSNGINQSFGFLMDGAGLELAAGDTVYLCAGACDGLGTGTYLLETTTQDRRRTPEDVVIAPRVSGTATNPITITVYCDNGNCETVILSGDSNGDGLVGDGTDHIVCNDVIDVVSAFNRPYYSWLGDPNGDGAPNLIFEKTEKQIFHITEGAQNWIIDGIEFRRTHKQHLWDDGNLWIPGLGTNGCDQFSSGQRGYAIHAGEITTTLTITNNLFHHLCGFALRITNNPFAGSILIDNNEFYNIHSAANDFNSQNVTYSNNYLHDTSGISVESRMRHVAVEDNLITCPGDWVLLDPGRTGGARCIGGISVDGTGGAGGNQFENYDIALRRNTIWGTLDVEGTGAMNQPIVWNSARCGDTADFTCPDQANPLFLIENNMIWRQKKGDGGRWKRAGISVDNSPSAGNFIIIQYNSIYDTNRYGISLRDGTHLVRGNLIVDAALEGEIRLTAESVASVFEDNNIHPGSGGGDLVCISNQDDATCNTTYDCAGIGGFGTRNICQQSTFVNVAGGPDTWDLHLADADTGSRDVISIEGLIAVVDYPIEDFDKEIRPYPNILPSTLPSDMISIPSGNVGELDVYTRVDENPHDGDTTHLRSANQGDQEYFRIDVTGLNPAQAITNVRLQSVWQPGATSPEHRAFRVGLKIAGCAPATDDICWGATHDTIVESDWLEYTDDFPSNPSPLDTDGWNFLEVANAVLVYETVTNHMENPKPWLTQLIPIVTTDVTTVALTLRSVNERGRLDVGADEWNPASATSSTSGSKVTLSGKARVRTE